MKKELTKEEVEIIEEIEREISEQPLKVRMAVNPQQSYSGK